MQRLKIRFLRYAERAWWPYARGAVVVALLIVVLTGVAVWQEAQRYRERAEVFTHNTSQLLAQHIREVFLKADGLLTTVAYQHQMVPSIHGLRPADFNALLQQHLKTAPEFMDIRVLDAQGILRYGTGADLPAVSAADREYFQRLRDLPPGSAHSPMIFSGPLLTRLSKKWVLILARRMEHADGRFAGVVFVSLPNEAFGAVFSSVKLGPADTIVLRTAGMAQVDRFPRGPQPEKDIGNTRVSQTLRDLLLRQPHSGTYEATTAFDQVTRYYSYLQVGNYPFYLIVGVAKHSLFARMGSNLVLMLGMSTLMVVLSSVGFWRIYRLTQQRTRAQVDAQAAHIMDVSPLPMLVADLAGVVYRANQAALELFGYTAEELIGKDGESLVAASSQGARADMRERFLRAPAGQRFHEKTELLGLHKTGTKIPLRVTLASLVLEQTPYLIMVLEDITELQEAQQSLARLAHYDPLTQLPNRRLFFERVEQGLALARRRGSHLALLFLDLDRFKPVNDRWGHAVGDQLLQQVAQRISACLREADAVGRIGGDEFVVLLTEVQTPQDAVQVAHKIRQALGQPFVVDDKTLQIAACVGVALFPEHGQSYTELARHADSAMYQAKALGRDRVILYEPEAGQGVS